jgi:hypothetical protein
VLSGIVALVMLAFAALLLSRGRHNRAAAMLAMSLLGIAATFPLGGSWAPHPDVAALLWFTGRLAGPCIAYFWILLSLEVSGGASRPSEARLVHAVAVLFLIEELAMVAAFEMGLNEELAALEIALNTANQLVGYGILAINYRRNDAAGRNRIKIVFLAFVLILLGNVAANSIVFAASEPARFALGIAQVAATLAASALLAYAVLRNRLFDFNFALNRTLVYAAVSFVLLATFGLAKWVIEHLIPESWHAGSEYYSVAIALGLFLVLHRVHNWAERNVERVFFSPWHKNEEALRRFVTAAGHFEQTPVLCRAFGEELDRFSGGAGAAVYLRDRSGAYGLQCGGLAAAPDRIEADDLALALMRAERRPVRLATTPSALPGALALPMLDHGKLAGFALLGAKPGGADYRPDEIEALGKAAHQVGLDLQAMRASELEAEIAGLSAQVAALGAQLSATGARRKRTAANLIK